MKHFYKRSVNYVVELFFLTIVCAFIISSLKFIYEFPELKKNIDFFRLSLVSFVFFISFRMVRFNVAIFIFSIVSFPYILFKFDVFAFQLIVGLLLAWFVFNFDYERILIKSLMWAIFLLAGVVFLVKIGAIESGVGVNHLASQSTFIVEHKDDWGFWHPNVVSFLVIACIISSFYLSAYRIYILSLIIYTLILTGTVSRTFIIVPLLTAIFVFFEKIGVAQKKFFLFCCLSFYFLSFLLSLFFVFPELTSFFLGDAVFNNLDIVLSYRLSIAQRVLEPLSFFELLSGAHKKNIEVDSIYINFVLSFGVLLYIFMLLFLLYSGFIAFMRKASKEMFFLSIFFLLSNFENISGISSLFYITACIAFFSIYKPRKKAIVVR